MAMNANNTTRKRYSTHIHYNSSDQSPFLSTTSSSSYRICEEFDTSSGLRVVYSGDGSVSREELKGTSYSIESKNRWHRVQRRLYNVLAEVFLPADFPDSVSDDYLVYQFWDSVQAYCSNITGTLSTKALLAGVGVGNAETTAAAATLTWLLRDGTSHAGRIFFAWTCGSDLDYNSKTWRLRADVLNDAATCIELIAPAFPNWFATIACVASLCKAIVGVAGGATRASLSQHQARDNNIADVTAKDGSQETLVNLAGLLTGVFVLPLVWDTLWCVWGLFVLFTTLHIYANYRAVRSLCFNTFNMQRAHIIFTELLASGVIPTPDVVMKKERVFLLPVSLGGTNFFDATDMSLELGCSLHHLNSGNQASIPEMMSRLHESSVVEHAYYFHIEWACERSRRGRLHVAITTSATHRDILIVLFVYYKFLHLLKIAIDTKVPSKGEFSQATRRLRTAMSIMELGATPNATQTFNIEKALMSLAIEDGNTFIESLKASHWESDRIMFPSGRYRIQWNKKEEGN